MIWNTLIEREKKISYILDSFPLSVEQKPLVVYQTILKLTNKRLAIFQQKA